MRGPVSMRFGLKPLLAGFSDAIFPPRCLGCDRLFHRQPAAAGQGPGAFLVDYFCPSCSQRWTAVTSPLCTRCGMAFTSREGPDHWCGRCLDRPGAFTRARAVGIYDGSLRIAIHALTFKGRTRLAGPLGRLLLAAYRRYWQAGEIDVVAPVPLHRSRFRKRGFNQAYLLMHSWELPGETVVVRDLLVRCRATAPQTGLDRRQRRINIKNAFAVNRSAASTGKRVLLVDDVLTTGATVEACAAVLLNDGALQVDVLTLARAYPFCTCPSRRGIFWPIPACLRGLYPRRSAAAPGV